MAKTLFKLFFFILISKANAQINEVGLQKSDTIVSSIDLSKLNITGLPCPNSSTKAGGPWTYEEAEKRKNEIYKMELTKKNFNWKNPTSGGAIHINNKDEIEIYKFTFGIFKGRNDTALNFIPAPKDTSIIIRSDEIWYNVSGIGEGNETSVLITSEYDLKKSESIKKIMEVLWKPGVQIYYITIAAD